MSTRARRGRRAVLGPGAQGNTSKVSQRERLVQAMIELSARSGSQQVTVAELCAGAGVSAQTFYEQFHDKEDLLASAYTFCAETILGQMDFAVAHGERSQMAQLALETILAALARDRDAARMLFLEPVNGTARILEERTLTEAPAWASGA
jgi:AcrR family transcriptional regulator